MFTEEEKESLRLARQIFAGPNVSVAGGELACEKYLASLKVIDYILQKVTENDSPITSDSQS